MEYAFQSRTRSLGDRYDSVLPLWPSFSGRQVLRDASKGPGQLGLAAQGCKGPNKTWLHPTYLEAKATSRSILYSPGPTYVHHRSHSPVCLFASLDRAGPCRSGRPPPPPLPALGSDLGDATHHATRSSTSPYLARRPRRVKHHMRVYKTHPLLQFIQSR